MAAKAVRVGVDLLLSAVVAATDPARLRLAIDGVRLVRRREVRVYLVLCSARHLKVLASELLRSSHYEVFFAGFPKFFKYA